MEPARLQNASYFWRLLDIIKAPEGRELLDQLTQSVDLIVRVFTHQPDPSQEKLVKVGAYKRLCSYGCVCMTGSSCRCLCNSQTLPKDCYKTLC